MSMLVVNYSRSKVPKNMEIVCMSRRWGKLFVGLFIFLGPGRLVRPVRCLRTGQTEWIGWLGRSER